MSRAPRTPGENLNRLAGLRIWMMSPSRAGLCCGGGEGTRFLHLRQQHWWASSRQRRRRSLGVAVRQPRRQRQQLDKVRNAGPADLGLRVLRRPNFERRLEARGRNGVSTDGPVDIHRQRRCARGETGGRWCRRCETPGRAAGSLAGPGVELAARRPELRAASKEKTKSAGGNRCY